MDVLVLIHLVKNLECIKPTENLEIYEAKKPNQETGESQMAYPVNEKVDILKYLKMKRSSPFHVFFLLSLSVQMYTKK